MEASPNPFRDRLQDKTVNELRIVARKLHLKRHSKMAKADLIQGILTRPPGTINDALDISFWDRRRPKRYVILFGLITGCATLYGLYWTLFPNDTPRQKELASIVAKRDALQAKLDEEHARSHQLVRGVEHALGTSEEMSRTDPDVTRLSLELKELLAHYDKQYANRTATKIDDLQLRLARATLANAEARYNDAAALITETDLRNEQAKTDFQHGHEATANRIFADAQFGLHNWARALASYDRVQELKPNDVEARRMRATCLTYLNRVRDSEREWQSLLEDLTTQFNHDGTVSSGIEAATAFANFGGAQANDGQLQDAIVSLTTAKNLLFLLFKKSKTLAVGINLAATLTRLGDVLADIHDHKNGLEEYNHAVTLYELYLKSNDYRLLGLRIEYAHCLRNRSSCLFEMGNTAAAFKDVDSAIAIQTEVIEKSGHHEIRDALAMSLTNRAAILSTTGGTRRALHDANDAIDIYRQEITEHKRVELRRDMAYALETRGSILSGSGDYAASSKDFVDAIVLLTQLIKSGESDVGNLLASVEAEYGEMLLELHNSQRIAAALVEAQGALTDAKRILGTIIHKQGRVELENSFAIVLNLRAAVLGRRHEFSAAKDDLEQAIAIYSRSRATPLGAADRQRFAKCLTNYGAILFETGGTDMAIMKAFEDALGIHSQLLKEGENAIALDRAITLSVRARVLQNTGRGNEARADLDEAIRIVEKSVADGQSKSARFLPRLKRQLDAAIHGKKFDDQE